MTIENPEDAAYDEPWTKLLTILEDEGIPSLAPGEVMRMTQVLHRVNQLMLDKIIGSDNEEMFRYYLCSLQTCVLIMSRQNELQTSEMYERMLDMGLKPLTSNRLDEEKKDDA